jgi:hypothetical protein
MKKNHILIFPIILCLLDIVPGQTTLPNGGFETWQNVGSNTEEPTNWNGNKTGGGLASLGPQTCFRESSGVHSGAYCLKLENGTILGTSVNATVTTGKIEVPSINASDGYIHTVTSDSDFNYTFTGRPDSLVGWFKFNQGGTDIGRIQAILHGSFDVEVPDQGSSASFIVGEASYDLPNGNNSNWTRFSVPFTYNNETIPSYVLLIAMASTSIGDANSNSILWVDDLSVVYSGVGVVENDFGDKLQIYPNPTKGKFSIDLGADYKSVTASLTGLNGKLIQSKQYRESQLLNMTLDEPAGIYFLTIVSENKKAVIRLLKE